VIAYMRDNAKKMASLRQNKSSLGRSDKKEIFFVRADFREGFIPMLGAEKKPSVVILGA
jgi:hypothetical protein